MNRFPDFFRSQITCCLSKKKDEFAKFSFPGTTEKLRIKSVDVEYGGYKLADEPTIINFVGGERNQPLPLKRILSPINEFAESLIPSNPESKLKNFPTLQNLKDSYSHRPDPNKVTLVVENKSKYHVDICLYHYSGLRTDERSKKWHVPENPFRYIGRVKPAPDAEKLNYGKLSFDKFGWTPGFYYVFGSVQGKKVQPIKLTPYNIYAEDRFLIRVNVGVKGNNNLYVFDDKS